MKLLRLKLGVPFRSLAAGFEVHFLREWDYERCFEFQPYCLAGRNGSGKSNVLEALAAIFYHIECIYLDYRPDGFAAADDTELTDDDGVTIPPGFSAKHCKPDVFELEYFFPNDALEFVEPWPVLDDRPYAHIRITKAARQRPEIHWVNRAEYEENAKTLLSRMEVKDYLPKYIVGYSSGHNEILSLPFFKMRFIHFDEYRKNLSREDRSKKMEGRMIYVDDQFSQAILICHFLFRSEAVTQVFEDKVGLKGIRRFRIIIRRHHRFPISEERLEGLSAEDRKVRAKATDELTSLLNGFEDRQGLKEGEIGKYRLGLIDKLIKCASTYYEDSYVTKEGDEASDLYLDYWVNDATKRAFQVHFGESSGKSEDYDKAKSALNLFQAFQTLITLNYYKVDEVTKEELYQSKSLYVNETISTPASHERITRLKECELTKKGVTKRLYMKGLSDGEHQLLHTIGLCLLYRYEPALFLLDEPETHLNPDWRASYISILRDALEANKSSGQVMREVLLTSHSPFIISDCRKENVLVFKKDTDNQVTCTRPDFETFGASANAITIKVFGQTETIGDYAMKTITDLRDRLEAGEDPDELINEAGKELGDSVEKVLFVNQALNKKEVM